MAGTKDKVKGALKEAAGKVTGDLSRSHATARCCGDDRSD